MKFSPKLFFFNLLVVLFSLPSLGLSQTNLNERFESAVGDDKIELGIQLLESLPDSAISNSKELAKKMYSAAKNSKNEQLKAKLFKVIGDVYSNNNQFELAIGLLQKSSNLYGNLEQYEEQVITENSIAALFASYGNYVSAIQHLYRADSISKNFGTGGITRGTTLLNLGLALSEVGLFELSNDYLESALKSSNDSALSIDIQFSLLLNSVLESRLYSANENFQSLKSKNWNLQSQLALPLKKAVVAYHLAFSHNKNEAQQLIQEVLQTLDNNDFPNILSAKIHLILAKTFALNGNDKKAIESAKKARTIVQQTKNLLLHKKAINTELLSSAKLKTYTYDLALSLDSIDKAITKRTGLDLLRIVQLESAYGKMTSIENELTKLSEEKEEGGAAMPPMPGGMGGGMPGMM